MKSLQYFLVFWVFNLCNIANGQFFNRVVDYKDGLSNNSVISLFQDSKGFMWIGTYDGLNFFDGANTVIWKNESGNTRSIPDNSVYDISGDDKNNIWVAGRHGLSCYNTTTKEFSYGKLSQLPKIKNGNINCNIHRLFYTKQLGLLVASEQYGLIRIDSNNNGITVPIVYNKTITNTYEALTVTGNNQTAWFVANKIGLFCYDSGKGSAILLDSSINNFSSSYLYNDLLFLGNTDEIVIYSLSKQKITNKIAFKKSPITSISVAYDKLWIGTDGSGLLYTDLSGIDNTQKQFTLYQEAKSNAVSSLLTDKKGMLWIGYLRGGVELIYKKRNNPFHVNLPKIKNQVASNFAFVFYEDNKDGIWIGTDGAGITYWNKSQKTFDNFNRTKINLTSDYITGLLGQSDQLWISSWMGGVDRMNLRDKQIKHYDLYNPAKNRKETNAWLVFKDHTGQLWTSTTNNGTLYKYDLKADSFRVFDERLENIQSLTEDNKGNLWAGNYNYLIKIDQITKRHIFYKIGYPVRSIVDADNGHLLIGTDGGGLLQINTSNFHYKRYTILDGLPGNSVLRIIKDKKGKFWLSTFNGLASLNLSNGKISGMAISDINERNQYSYNAGIMLKDGKLLFGGINGLDVIDPTLKEDGKETIIPWLTDIKMGDGKLLPKLQTNGFFKVPYQEAASLIFQFSAPDYLNAGQQFQYRLKGWDKEWSPITNNRMLSYSRLSPGKYELQVKVKDNSNNWSNSYSIAYLQVLSPWYLSWWAVIMYVLVFVVICYAYLKYVENKHRMYYEMQATKRQLRDNEERNQKKLNYFTHIAHELVTPLTLIVSPLNELVRDQESKTVSKDMLNIIFKSAKRLSSMVNQIMIFKKADTDADAVNESNFDLLLLIQDVCECYEVQALEKNIQYSYPKKVVLPVYIRGDREKIEIILFNLLSNAFKYVDVNGFVSFQYSFDANGLNIQISNSGKGIDPSLGNDIFEKYKQGDIASNGFGIGLFLVKHFCQIQGGSINYTSYNQKTNFVLQLPIFQEQNNVLSNDKNEIKEASLSRTTDIIDVSELNVLQENQQHEHSLLYVDDDTNMQDYVKHILIKYYNVQCVSSGEDALKFLEKEIPDILISDIHMSGFDGIELCAKVKDSSKWGHLPIILLTASQDKETKLRGLAVGVDDYITKPFEKDLVLSKLNGILKNRSKVQEYYLNQVTLKENIAPISKHYQEFLQKCISIVEDNLDNDSFDIKVFSQLIGMSHSNLYKKVKLISGKTVNGFIRSIKIRKAAELMIRNSESVSEASFHVGINDAKYFREQFKMQFGINPSEYVKRYRGTFKESYHIV